MTKTELNEYRSVVKEIMEAEILITSNTKQCKVTGSDCNFPYTKHTISVTGLQHTEENSVMLSELNALKRRREKIEQFVTEIPDRITKKIFILKYIYGDTKKSWNYVAYKIGGGNTADSVRKTAMRYLLKTAKK